MLAWSHGPYRFQLQWINCSKIKTFTQTRYTPSVQKLHVVNSYHIGHIIRKHLFITKKF